MAYILIEVDDEDADLLVLVNSVMLSNGMSLQRAIGLRMGMELDGKHVDHINGDSTNSRRYNLRPATTAQNSTNKRLRSDSTSGYKGVTWSKRDNKWNAVCQLGGVRKTTSHKDVIEAARSYDRMALEMHGEFARTNFPKEDYA